MTFFAYLCDRCGRAYRHEFRFPCVWLVSPQTPNPGEETGGASWMLMIFALGVGEGCITRRRGGLGITAKSLLQTGIRVFVLVNWWG